MILAKILLILMKFTFTVLEYLKYLAFAQVCTLFNATEILTPIFNNTEYSVHALLQNLRLFDIITGLTLRKRRHTRAIPDLHYLLSTNVS